MDDIVRDAGLSPDVANGQFADKNDVLRAIGALNKAAASGVLRSILQEAVLPPVAEIVTRMAIFFETCVANGDPVGVGPQAWGIALHDPEVNAIIRDVFGELRELWIRVAVRMLEEGQLGEGADPQAVGRALFSIVMGFMVQSLLGDAKSDHLRRALQVLAR